MGKSPGFWFYTGDWLKDPELRFCSIFARGLLIDLLCILFESKQQGYASRPDGSPRSDEELVDAVSGGTRESKLAALAELEASGVLSRNENNVLFSRRMARLAELSQTRSKAGSKGGSKSQAKLKQNSEQTEKQKGKQKRGVSVSVSDTDIYTRGHCVDPEFRSLFQKFVNSSEVTHEWTVSPVTIEDWIYRYSDLPIAEAAEAVRFSIQRGVKVPFVNGEWRQARLLTPEQSEPEFKPPTKPTRGVGTMGARA